MPAKKGHLERARIAQWILGISGLMIILIGLNAKWALENFPALIYALVLLAFVDLGVLGYFLAHLFFHLRQVRREEKQGTLLTVHIKLMLGIMVAFAVADALYATFTHTWNQYSMTILVGLLFGVAAIPFHVLQSEYARRKVD